MASPQGIKRGCTELLHYRVVCLDGDCSTRCGGTQQPQSVAAGGAETRAQQSVLPLCTETGISGPLAAHVKGRNSLQTPTSPEGRGGPVAYLLRQPWPAQRAHDESPIGTSTEASRLAGGLGSGGTGSRTRGLEPQDGHCVRSIPVTSCIHCTTLFGLRRGGSAGWPSSSRQRRRYRALCRLARKP